MLQTKWSSAASCCTWLYLWNRLFPCKCRTPHPACQISTHRVKRGLNRCLANGFVSLLDFYYYYFMYYYYYFIYYYLFILNWKTSHVHRCAQTLDSPPLWEPGAVDSPLSQKAMRNLSDQGLCNSTTQTHTHTHCQYNRKTTSSMVWFGMGGHY